MRVNTDNTYLNHSNTGVESVTMSFDENSLAFLMDVMTNLYSDTDLAPIREYSSNADDEHRAAGVTVPIEVSLPSRFDPTFSVQDFGRGMNKDDLFNIYSKYGYSTKRDNDTETGMLGLGSKSGLTYTSQFTVTTVKDGKQIIATVARGEDGAGTINILHEQDYDGPTGTTITIPVHNVEEFNRKALAFFRWWEPGRVLIDGREPEYPEGNSIKVSDDIVIHPRGELDSDYVVMGCVAYPVGDRLSGGLPYDYHVVAYVPMGAVNFPPNREELQYTRKTNKVIEDLVQRRKDLTKQVAEADIAQAKTHADAVRAYSTWSAILPGVTAKYQGDEIPMELRTKTVGQSKYGGSIRQQFWVYEPKRYRNKVSSRSSINIHTYIDAFVVIGFENKTVSTSNRAKIDEYMRQNGLTNDRIILAPEDFGGVWTNGVATASWDDVKAIKLPRTKSGSRGSFGTFEVYDKANGVQRVTDIAADDIIVLSPRHVNEYQRNWGALYFRKGMLLNLWPDTTFVMLATNRWAKFERENDNVRTITDAIKEYLEEFEDSLTEFERAVLTGGRSDYEAFGRLNADNIDDPEVVTLIEQVNNARDVTTEFRQISKIYDTVFPDLPSPTIEARDNIFDAVVDRYPLARYTGEHSTAHTEHYINLVYADGKDA